MAESETGDVTYSAQRITVIETEEGTSELSIEDLEPLTENGNTFNAMANGYYLITATAKDGTWSQVVLEMAQVDNDLPVASLSLADRGEGEEPVLSWTVTKSNPKLSPITEVYINEHKLTIEPDRTAVGGTFPIQYGGTYTLTAADKAGHRATAEREVDGLPIQAEDNSICTVTDSWNQARNNGVIAIDPAAITGGVYDSTNSTPAKNDYHGRYEVLLTQPEGVFDAEAVRQELLQAYADQYFQDHPEALPDDPNAVMPEEALNEALAQRETEAWADWEKNLLAEANDTSWIAADGAEFTGLAPGEYLVLFRDANDKGNSDTVARRTLTVEDEAVVVTAESTPERDDGRNGTVTVQGEKGRLDKGTYQFLLRPVESGESELLPVSQLTDPLDPEKFPEDEGWTTPAWQLSDLDAGTMRSSVFTGLRAGWYQVAVRAMEDVSAAEMQELLDAYAAMRGAEQRVKDAEAGLTSAGLNAAAAEKLRQIREALQTWQTAGEAEQDAAWNRYLALIDNSTEIETLLKAWEADSYEEGDAKEAYDAAVDALTMSQARAEAEAEKADADEALPLAIEKYETLKASLEQTAEKAYADDPTLWDNAATLLIQVEAVYTDTGAGSGGPRRIQSYDLEYDQEKNLVRVHFTEDRNDLSEGAERQLIEDNRTMDILAYSDTMEAWIPAGTLSEGDDIMEMLLPFEDLPGVPGWLVQYTGRDGETHPVVWSYVAPGKVYYVAAQPGEYELVRADVSFPDVAEDFWGAEAVAFVAARELFQGDDAGRFQPGAPMTRAMFVTVLCRLAGAEPGRGGTEFTDVPADAWYAPYVAWATEEGIVSGYGDGRFGPDDPVSREQMCVLLDRMLRSLGIDLPAGSVGGFVDGALVSDWAVDAVGRFTNFGLVQGVGGNRFAPADSASRAEVAAVYMRLIQRLLTR